MRRRAEALLKEYRQKLAAPRGRAVVNFVRANPGKWISLREFQPLTGSLGALITPMRVIYGWDIENHTKVEIVNGRRVVKSWYRLNLVPPSADEPPR